MERVTVIAAAGARITGPCRVQLTKAQHARRVSALGDWKRGGVFKLNDGGALEFKRGERFGYDTPEKLNRLLFEVAGDGGDGTAEIAGQGGSAPTLPPPPPGPAA